MMSSESSLSSMSHRKLRSGAEAGNADKLQLEQTSWLDTGHITTARQYKTAMQRASS